MKTYEENVGLIYYAVNKYSKHKELWDDYYQEASIGLWKAVKTFKAEKNIKFATYAMTVITNQIFMFENKMKRQNRNYDISFDESLDDTEDLYSLIGSGINVIDNFFIRDSLKKFLSELDNRDKKIIKLKLQGKNQEEIGKELNLSQSYVARLIISMKNKFKKY